MQLAFLPTSMHGDLGPASIVHCVQCGQHQRSRHNDSGFAATLTIAQMEFNAEVRGLTRVYGISCKPNTTHDSARCCRKSDRSGQHTPCDMHGKLASARFGGCGLHHKVDYRAAASMHRQVLHGRNSTPLHVGFPATTANMASTAMPTRPSTPHAAAGIQTAEATNTFATYPKEASSMRQSSALRAYSYDSSGVTIECLSACHNRKSYVRGSCFSLPALERARPPTVDRTICMCHCFETGVDRNSISLGPIWLASFSRPTITTR